MPCLQISVSAAKEHLNIQHSERFSFDESVLDLFFHQH